MQAFSTVGTPDYIAPEALLKKGYGMECDWLLCDVDHRLGAREAQEIKAHPWFKGVAWEKLYEMEAAFKPDVIGELDTQNFMKFEEVDPPARTGSGS
ncbi:hypothetical protein Ancab_017958 [Ancistrocladus abbreviatus]